LKISYLIVGSGLAGSVLAERIANVLKKEVLILEKRNHVGGNVYDFKDENGILIHKYGPHAFHTNNKRVWDYLSQFTEWYPYFHKVLAVIDGIKVPLPFNLNSIYKVFPLKLAGELEEKLTSKYGYNKKIPILELKKEEDPSLKFLAQYIYEKVFLGYTLKQWGVSPDKIDPSVTARVPVYISRDDRYFQDKYQGIPKDGYTKMIERMLDHPKIKIELETDFFKVKDKIKYDFLIYTGPIDEFFEFKYSKLPYRSLYFSFENYPVETFQEVAQVNYPENYDFTRITEFKHFLPFRKSHNTTIAFEYPCEYTPKENEPYYPVPNEENKTIYNKYKRLVQSLSNTVFIGRLAEYKYYNMDQIVARALEVFYNRLINKKGI